VLRRAQHVPILFHMIYQPGPTILGMRNGGKVLGVECRKCRHRVVFTDRELIEHSNVGEMAGIDYMARRMRCALCGKKSPTWTQIPKTERDLWLAEAGG